MRGEGGYGDDCWIHDHKEGKFLKRMKPSPLRSSARMERIKGDMVGKGKVDGRWR
jgi:hypothetical protein